MWAGSLLGWSIVSIDPTMPHDGYEDGDSCLPYNNVQIIRTCIIAIQKRSDPK